MQRQVETRKALGISLADVSRWSGVALETIRRYEAGDVIATPESRERLRRTYDAIVELRTGIPKGAELAAAAGFSAELEAQAELPPPASVEELEEEELEAMPARDAKAVRKAKRSIVDNKVGDGKAYRESLDALREDVLKRMRRDGLELDAAIDATCADAKLNGRERAHLYRVTMDVREAEIAELEDRNGACEGTRLRAGEECACLLYDQIGKAKSRTLLGAARVVVIEANDAEAMVRVIKTSSELAPRFLKKEMRLTRAELFSDRSKDERNAFRKLVSKYWGPDVNRGESATATHAKKAKRAR